MKYFRIILWAVLLTACFVAGRYGAPVVKTAYAMLFPPTPFKTGNYNQLYAKSGTEVVLFSTSTCPYCKKARDVFAKNGINYTDYIIDKSKKAHRMFVKNNGEAVPMIFIANRKIVGFNLPAIQAAIDILPVPRKSVPLKPQS